MLTDMLAIKFVFLTKMCFSSGCARNHPHFLRSCTRYEVVLLSNQVVLPSNQVVLPSNQVVLPSNQVVLPNNQVVLPSCCALQERAGSWSRVIAALCGG